MNKQELIEALAKETGLSKADSKRSLEAFTDIVQKQLKKGGQVRLIGFGTFSVRKRKARKGINPQTGAQIQIKARKVPHFAPGSELKNAL
ncbi:MAG: HU family DNA-binding protein [bacterium]|nr:HU family DNA-binding protein [bacterium]